MSDQIKEEVNHTEVVSNLINRSIQDEQLACLSLWEVGNGFIF